MHLLRTPPYGSSLDLAAFVFAASWRSPEVPGSAMPSFAHRQMAHGPSSIALATPRYEGGCRFRLGGWSSGPGAFAVLQVCLTPTLWPPRIHNKGPSCSGPATRLASAIVRWSLADGPGKPPGTPPATIPRRAHSARFRIACRLAIRMQVGNILAGHNALNKTIGFSLPCPSAHCRVPARR